MERETYGLPAAALAELGGGVGDLFCEDVS